MLAFDTQGKQLWKASFRRGARAAGRSQDGVVVARSGDGRIYGLDAADGKRRWVYQRPTPAPLTVRTHAGVVVERGAVFAGFPGGRLVALALATGNVGWEGVVAMPRGATELERVADVTSLPVGRRRARVRGGVSGPRRVLRPASGTTLWARDMSSVAGLDADQR